MLGTDAMLIHSLIIAGAVLWLPLTAAIATYNLPCPLLGPDFPPPSKLSANTAITTAKGTLLSNLRAALHNPTAYGQLDTETTSFSLDIFTAQGSIFTYHYSAPGLAHPAEGVSSFDSNTIYRLGSISKLWTVYLYLISVGDASFNDPITKYVPELAAYAAHDASQLLDNDIDRVSWNDITIAALMSHMAGVGHNAAPDQAQDDRIEQLTGLPPASAVNISFCGDPNIVQLPCDRAAFFQDYEVRHPVVAPFYTPIYSDASYQILGYALENITSKSFPDLFNQSLLVPLGTNATSYRLPLSSDSSIIPGNASISGYNENILDETPTGGYYSTINDMRRFGISILNSSFLTPSQTRRWMKPVAFTSNANQSVGAPWEIALAPGQRTSYIYAKAGNIAAYAGEIAFLPDYNVGFTVLAAGANSVFNAQFVSDMTAAILYPALEDAAREEANTVYAGVYSAVETNSSITVTTDEFPGLHIAKWTFGGKDVFPILARFTPPLAPPASDGTRLSVRMYPTGLTSSSGGVVTRTGWRIVVGTLPSQLDPGVFSGNCVSWTLMDYVVYGTVAFDEFLFNLGPNGQAVSIDPRVLQQNPLAKAKSSRRMVGRVSPMIRMDPSAKDLMA